MKKLLGVSIALLSSITLIIYITWRIGYTIPQNVNTISLIFAIMLVVFEVVSALELLIYYKQITFVKHPKPPKYKEKDLPHIDVFITTINESFDIVEQTVTACTKMKYPDLKKVHIYICDDGGRNEIKNLARSLKIGYIKRKDKSFAKAGNLNNALNQTKSPLVAMFDADMIPHENFLMETVPYFMGEDKEQMGFVQTPQTFYEPDMFQFNLYAEESMPNEHEYFYKAVQLSKNKSNSVIFCGTNAVVSRHALEDAGGFSTVSITEDFATGVEIQSKGYKCLAIAASLAEGLPPHNLRSLFRQRTRWARGNLQAGRRQNILFRSGLSLWQRINYFSAVTNWFFPLKQLIFLLAPVLFAVFGIVFVECTLQEVLMFWLPMYLMTNFSIWYFSKRMRKTRWTRIYETILAPALFLPTMMEAFGMTYDNFVVTDKKRRGDDDDSISYKIIYALPFFIGLILTSVGIYNVVLHIADGIINHYIVLFWLILNFYYLMVALQFVFSGRKYVASNKYSHDHNTDEDQAVVAHPANVAADIGESRIAPTPVKLNKKEVRTHSGMIQVVRFLAMIGLVAGSVVLARFVPTDNDAHQEEIMEGPHMHRGISMGNALEARRGYDWGLTIEYEHFQIISRAGFDHIRLPVRFQAYLDEDGILEEEFMEMLDSIIMNALISNLTVILDFHHFDEIMERPREYREMFLSIWEQLALRYQFWPNELVFELLNEPQRMLHSVIWNEFATEAIELIRETNPTRTIVVGPTNFYSIFDLRMLDLPDDNHLILAFNYYYPHRFAFQGDPWHPGFETLQGIEWGTPEDYEYLAHRFESLAEWAEEEGVRLALTEFGVTRAVPSHLRARWTEAVRRQAEQHGFSWVYWEFASGFGIFDLETGEWDEEVLQALMSE
ncbi:MAG: cellulase family glycosylhydrolase [Pseudomonadales bacterium]|jgi:cellulose synthase/poly-beta-1,6-N-acetylglucosamine synthase-like glycosyltransferase/aryl-phospho-beta-D-glucosidase BglC (GH1 family)|nr:cellulase family glycosylhydrolase [Pseudomonadales bacterium]